MMFLPSIATALTIVSAVSATPNNFRRQTSASAAASAALSLNSAVAYQICIIAQGAFAAAAALGMSSSRASNCDSLLANIRPNGGLPVVTVPDIITNITLSGCSNVPNGTCSLAFVSASGSVIQVEGDTPTVGSFRIQSSNGNCSGVRTPFTLFPSISTGFVSSFNDLQWNINCSTGLMTLADSSLHICLTDNVFFAAPATNACVNFNQFFATSVAAPARRT